ncbi:MAG: hypothetical protein ACFHVJ_18065 [Aestuariibacter sp.]
MQDVNSAQSLVAFWFACWETGDIDSLPIAESFTHTSPFGKIDGKKAYLELVQQNLDKFLSHRFEIIDGLYEPEKACIRYLAIQTDFELAVTEWHYCKNGQIHDIVAYYHIGEIREDRQLKRDNER